MDPMAAAYSVRITIDLRLEDHLSAELSDFSPTGIVTHDLPDGRCALVAWFENAQAAQACADALAAYSPTLLQSDEQDWNAVWQAAWTPIEAGKRWFLTPPSFAGETPPGRIRLDMHPGILFGNGDHPTTLLCLESMETCVTPGSSFLDVGCGSGLLTHAAKLLDARVAAGCDLDPRAASAAARFGAGAFIGSVDAIKPRSIDVLVANIQLGVLQTLMPAIAAALSPTGSALLSGVLDSQRREFIAVIEGAGFACHQIAERDGWLMALASHL